MAVEEQKGRKRLALNITTNPTKRKKTKAKKSDDRGAVLKPVEEDEDLQPDVPSLASKDRALATLEDIALALNSDVAAESSRGVAALLKCCQHAELELRAFAAKRLSFEPKLRREKAGELERSLVIFQYLHSSPEVAELLRLWEEARKVHNHRGCGDVMQLLAAILDVTVVPSLGHVVGHICKVVIRDKMKWIYGALSADTPRNGKGEPCKYPLVMCSAGLSHAVVHASLLARPPVLTFGQSFEVGGPASINVAPPSACWQHVLGARLQQPRWLPRPSTLPTSQ